MRRRTRVVAALLLLVAAREGRAGPPFLTDDPEPVELHHWEAYLYSTRDAARSLTSGEGLALEFNLGAAPNLQLHIQVPLATSSPAGDPTAHGLGDIELGVKYRFVEESGGRPQVGVFPLLEVPTGDASRGLGNGRLWARIPIWVQKSWGPWTTYGGGGYAINSAPGARDYAFAGWLLQRDLSKRLTLGAEAFAQGAGAVGGRGSTILDAGGILTLREGFSVLFSAGHTVAGERHRVAYLGLYWTWGRSGRAASLGADRVGVPPGLPGLAR